MEDEASSVAAADPHRPNVALTGDRFHRERGAIETGTSFRVANMADRHSVRERLKRSPEGVGLGLQLFSLWPDQRERGQSRTRDEGDETDRDIPPHWPEAYLCVLANWSVLLAA